MPKRDLDEWLQLERRVLADYAPGTRKSDQRARWASGRAKRIEAELQRRVSG